MVEGDGHTIGRYLASKVDELEGKILDAVQDFEKETGLRVRSIKTFEFLDPKSLATASSVAVETGVRR